MRSSRSYRTSQPSVSIPRGKIDLFVRGTDQSPDDEHVLRRIYIPIRPTFHEAHGQSRERDGLYVALAEGLERTGRTAASDSVIAVTEQVARATRLSDLFGGVPAAQTPIPSIGDSSPSVPIIRP